MMLKAVFKWQNNDSTLDLNTRFSSIFDQGVLSGGFFTTIAGQLKIAPQPFYAISRSGMLVYDDSPPQLSIPTGQTSVVAVLAKYAVGADPTIQYSVTEQSIFNGLVDKDDYIIFGNITLAPGATEVTAASISYSARQETDQLGRSSFRGVVAAVVDLPTTAPLVTDNRLGDFYVIGSASPSLYAWNGLSWENLTNTTAIAAELALHRANFYTDEKHLTDSQAEAALGTSGTPSLTNRYVTNSDTRLPTAGEKQALAGSDGAPSSTNKYITQQFFIAEPNILSYLAAGFSVIVNSSDGPFYVGKAAVGTANVYFSLLDQTENRGYVNSVGIAPKVTGVFTDAGLTIPLNPSIDADANGFYSNTVYLQVDATINTSFRVSYGKKTTFNSLDKGFAIKPNPNSEIIPSKVVQLVQNIKGYPFDTVIPSREQNINLRNSLDSVQAYLGSALETSLVATAEDYERLSANSFISPDFQYNVGVNPYFHFQNTLLSGFSYTEATGTITYTAPVDLSAVVVGDLFRDGAGNYFSVTSVNDGTDSLTIASTETGLIPASTAVSTSVGSLEDGSIVVNYNPRNVLLSELKFRCGSDVIPLKDIEQIPNTFEKVTGAIAWGVRRQGGGFDPRVQIYGGWQNNPKGFIYNSGSYGKIQITGFFNSVLLWVRYKSANPTLSVSINGQAATPITGTSGAPAIGGDNSLKLQKLLIADSLATPTEPGSTVTIAINGAAASSFEVHAIETCSAFNNSATYAEFESGRAFDLAEIVKRDLYSYDIPIDSLLTSRGRRIIYSADENSYQNSTTLLDVIDRDGVNNPINGTIGADSVSGDILTLTTSQAKNLRSGDLLILEKTTGSLDAKILKINSISGVNITLSSSPALEGALPYTVGVTHICSTDMTIPNVGQESEIARFNLPDDFRKGYDLDFETLDSGNRFVLAEDGTTIISGTELSVTTAGLTGTLKAVNLGATGQLRITALCSRMDIVVANSSAANPVLVSVDGSSSALLPFNFGDNAEIRRTIFFNARYQSHEVVLTGGGGNLAISEIILFGPKKPVVTDYPVEVADLVGLATYEPARNILSAPGVYTIGGVFFDASTYLKYSDGSGAGSLWQASVDFTKSPNGQYYYASRAASQVEFYFFGDTFELQYITGPDHGTFNVTVDGADLSTYVDVIGDYSTGYVIANAVSYGRKNIGVKCPTWGLHHVVASIPNPRTAGGVYADYKMAFVGFYIGSDNFFYSSQEKGLSSYAVDVRNLAAVDIPIKPVVVPQSEYLRTGIVPLTAGDSSKTIVFSSPVFDTNYVPIVTMTNVVDASPLFQPLTVTAKTLAGFTVSWNMPLDTNNYKLNYFTTGLN